MRTRHALPALALLVLATACGGDDDPTDGSLGGAPTTPQAPSSFLEAPAGTNGVLLAQVGLPDDPEAFEISLTTEDGRPVETVLPGEYEIRVSDPSRIHNFALSGPGVDEATSVSGTDDAVWRVTLEEGDYDYVCDPHPSMAGSFTVAS